MNPTTNIPGGGSAGPAGPGLGPVGPRYNRGIIGLMGGNPNNSKLSALYGMWQQHQNNQQQFDNGMMSGMEHSPGTEVDSALSPQTQDQPSPQGIEDTIDLADDSFARGKIVTSPTVAMLGEKGPEAVVPLNNQPDNKVSGAMLTDQPIAQPHTLGGTARARYAHPVGAAASARSKPIRADLPLKPNSAMR
jgi:hypothetical protein